MNKTANYEFTILVPLYNEEDNILNLEKQFSEYLLKASRKTCVLFVDDCSTDKSNIMLDEVCKRNPDFFKISLQKNQRLTGAVKAGFDNIYSKYIGYIDADMQTNPEDFEKLFDVIGENQMSIGWRTSREDGISKKIQSKIANNFRRSMTGDTAIDTCCPLKIIETKYAKKFPMFVGMHRFLPALIELQGGTYSQCPVRHYPRTAGVSKYTLWNRVFVSLLDCFAYRWMKKRYIDYSVKDSNI